MAEDGAHVTTQADVATLLENFRGYVNPLGQFDPWFTLPEVNRQFAWEDVPEEILTIWLDELVRVGVARTEIQDGERVWAWRS
jgi:hypothetical protein